jgi:hypothetical protein
VEAKATTGSPHIALARARAMEMICNEQEQKTKAKQTRKQIDQPVTILPNEFLILAFHSEI